MEQRRFRAHITASGYRAGAAIGTIVALVGALGAPFKWG